MIASKAAQALVPVALAGERASVAAVGGRRGARGAAERGALARAGRAVAEVAAEAAEAAVVACLVVGVGADALHCQGSVFLIVREALLWYYGGKGAISSTYGWVRRWPLAEPEAVRCWERWSACC